MLPLFCTRNSIQHTTIPPENEPRKSIALPNMFDLDIHVLPSASSNHVKMVFWNYFALSSSESEIIPLRMVSIDTIVRKTAGMYFSHIYSYLLQI